nr:MAG TPA: hypothetical protein [Caudoviricetes sp.]DAV81553.1 MAG TPA: hypothetical protein [Caudoviricetes sp.]
MKLLRDFPGLFLCKNLRKISENQPDMALSSLLL